MKKFITSALIALSTWVNATVIFDNTNDTPQWGPPYTLGYSWGNDYSNATHWQRWDYIEVPFNTGNYTSTLTSVGFPIYGNGNLVVDICSNVNGQPGAILGTCVYNGNIPAYLTLTYMNYNNVVLNPNTTYWVCIDRLTGLYYNPMTFIKNNGFNNTVVYNWKRDILHQWDPYGNDWYDGGWSKYVYGTLEMQVNVSKMVNSSSSLKN